MANHATSSNQQTGVTQREPTPGAQSKNARGGSARRGLSRLIAGVSAGLAAGVAALGLSVASAEPSDPVFGYWIIESGHAIVHISPCGEKACGRVVWMSDPTNDDGTPRLDSENDNPSLRTRPLCGMRAIGDFERAGQGDWQGGYIYDPIEGDVYDAYLEIQPDGSLKVRGFVRVTMIGKTQTWRRVGHSRGGC